MKTKTLVLLAGGKSTRMGFDKQELEINGERLVERNIKILKKAFEKILVITNREELYKNLGVETIKDIFPGHGPLSGIHTAMTVLEEDYFFLLAVDMPIINLDYISYIDQRYDPSYDGILVKREKSIEPMYAIYNNRLVTRAEELIKKDMNKVKILVDQGNFIFINEDEARVFDKDLNMYYNLNSIEDVKNFK